MSLSNSLLACTSLFSWEKSIDRFVEVVFVRADEISFTEPAFDIGDIEVEDEEDLDICASIVKSSTSIVVFAVVASAALHMLISDSDVFAAIGDGSSWNFVVLDVLSLV